MKYMSPNAWNTMSNSEKRDHFLRNEVTVDSQIVYGRQKFQAICGGVLVSNWKDSETEALKESARSIAANLQDVMIALDNEKNLKISTVGVKN